MTWKRTINPLPRRAAVTSGVPSASRAQVRSSRPAVGSARNLPRHGHLLRRGEAEKRAALSERSDVFGGLPRQRAAELGTAAPPQVSREKVVIAGGEAGAGKAQQDAALVEKLHNRLVLRSGRDAHIRERENRRLFAQQGNNGIARQIAPFADVGEGLKRALEMSNSRSSGWAMSALAPEAMGNRRRRERSSTSHVAPAERSTLDHDFRDFVTQFDRQVEARRRLPAVGRNRMACGRSPRPLASRDARLAFPRRAGLGPDQARRQSAGFVLDAGDCARAASIRRNLDGSGSRRRGWLRSCSRRRVRRRRRSTKRRSSVRARENARSPRSRPHGSVGTAPAPARAGGFPRRLGRAARCPERLPRRA